MWSGGKLEKGILATTGTTSLNKATDVMDMRTEGEGDDLQVTLTLRDGSEQEGYSGSTVITGTPPDLGPGKIGKGYKFVKSIGGKYDVFEKTVKAKSLGGQARAVYTKIKNKAGKTIRFFKDAFKRDGRHYERANKFPTQGRSRKLD